MLLFTISGEVKKMIHETFLRSSKAFTQRFCIGFGVVLLAMAGGMAHAQIAGTADVQGTVADPTGAVIQNAAVTLEHFHLRYIVDSAVTEPGLGVFGCDLG
jgi:hypothetical protein